MRLRGREYIIHADGKGETYFGGVRKSKYGRSIWPACLTVSYEDQSLPLHGLGWVTSESSDIYAERHVVDVEISLILVTVCVF